MRDLNGRAIAPFTPSGRASVVFFVATDCPVSNSYAPEIQRVCREYGPRGVECSLIYEDVDTHPSAAPSRSTGAHASPGVRLHRFHGCRRSRSSRQPLTRRPRSRHRPFVIDRSGEIRYRGPHRQPLRRARQDAPAGDRVTTCATRSMPCWPDGTVPHPETEALGCFITDPALLRKHDHE